MGKMRLQKVKELAQRKTSQYLGLFQTLNCMLVNTIYNMALLFKLIEKTNLNLKY